MKKIVKSLSLLLLGLVLISPQKANQIVLATVTSDGTVTFRDSQNELTINHASNITFNKQVVSGDDMTYFASYTALEMAGDNYLPAHVQVIDNRGTNQGWEMSVTMTEFSGNDATGKQTLEGAELSLQPTRGQHLSGESEPLIPQSELSNQLLRISQTPMTVLKATTDRGYGTSTYYFGDDASEITPTEEATHEEVKSKSNDKVQLFVPGYAKKNKNISYLAEMVWTLTTAP